MRWPSRAHESNIIELLVLNTANPTETWDLNLGLPLMAYRSAVQTSTGFTPQFLMYGREMRLPIDIIYRPPHREISRSQYAQEIRNTLEYAYKVAREKLHLAHERQKDYYDRRTQGSRYSVGDSVWLWSPVPKKGVAPKFHEPWTGPYKISKRLSDVTYELLDVSKNIKKIVYFDHFKKATVDPVAAPPPSEKQVESDSTSDESETESLTETKSKSKSVSKALLK